MAQKTQLTKASRIALAVVLVVFAVVEAYFVVTTNTAPPFAGTWRVVSYDTHTPTGALAASGFTDGRLTYDSGGRVTAQFSAGGRVPSVARDPEASGAAATAHLSYYGTYLVTRRTGTVSHHVEVANDPSLVRTSRTARYEFSNGNDTLRLTFVDASGRTTDVLVLTRLS